MIVALPGVAALTRPVASIVATAELLLSQETGEEDGVNVGRLETETGVKPYPAPQHFTVPSFSKAQV